MVDCSVSPMQSSMMIKKQWYLVQLCRGGIYRIEAATADLARQRVTYDYMERVKTVDLDDEQHPNEVEDY